MSHRLPQVFSLAPRGLDGVALVAATSRAGGLGILDAPDAESLLRVARLTGRPFAARVDPNGEWREWLDGSPPGLRAILATEVDPTLWDSFASAVHASGRLALADVTSRNSAEAAIAAGFDGLIASGDEAGGRVGPSSTFILTQELLALGGTPVWSRGGVGPDGASGCVAMGASGVVIDGATLLGRESPLSDAQKSRIARLDGGETVVVGPPRGPRWRVLAAPGSPALTALRGASEQGGSAFDEAAARWIGWSPDQAWPIGQDAAFAEGLARTFVTVGGIVAEVHGGWATAKSPTAIRSPIEPGPSILFASK